MPTPDSFNILVKGRKLGPFTIEQICHMRSRGDCDSMTRIAPIQHPEAWQTLDSFLKQLEARASQPTPKTPPPIAEMAVAELTTPISIIKPFPIFSLLLLHFLTLGIYTFFWSLSRHGILPKFRTDDPSTSKAIGLSFVPFYHLYWLFVVFVRLVDRLNQLSRTMRIGRSIPRAMGIIIGLLYLLPLGFAWIGIIVWSSIAFSPDPPLSETIFLFFVLPQMLTAICYAIAMPIFAGQIQSLLNACFEHQIRQLTRQ